ncbi:uncharacterized protein FTJAE_14227 [Fusarium tjaetaba]|uniref:Uncharacterized protein n=1 Tax=Fusarium tjaetaba TaxID=1567544 RepID=A0A8H5Q9J6_9HYPO|nr:uncharacterized protein FTJAE_14227 [Fusarium tjaetaba]KAF5611154.1 hypothetical protein FTJAE_14227 [Fusarium tjaetaba]
MDINNMCSFPEGGQQPGAIDYIITSLSRGIRNPTLVLRESAEVDNGSLPLDLPPDINDSDMDPSDVTLEGEYDIEEVERDPDIEGWIGFSGDAWPYFHQALFFGLRLLWSGVRGIASMFMMGLKLLLAGLYFAFVGGFEWSFLYLLIPIILIFIISEIQPRVHFFLRVIVALMLHVVGRLRASFTEYRG